MRLPFGLVLRRETEIVEKATVPVARSSFWGVVREPFVGAWQRDMECDAHDRTLAFAPVYACVSKIASDIAKLGLRLVEESDDGTWPLAPSTAPFWPVLRKPNGYQTRIQFMTQWIVSKLLYGNTYVLKQRDARGIVTALFVLDPRRVIALITEQGDVYYQLKMDILSGLPEGVTVPASEIIHDIAVPLFHPLCGVGPLYAAARSATQGSRIQRNSAEFFENMSRPSGLLSGPGVIDDVTAQRLKTYWEENYTGSKVGRLAVLGDGLKYEAMTIPASDAQLIEQLKWTVEDIARAFGIPLYKINSGPVPTSNNVEALEQQYYTGCLQILIESIELLLDEGLGLVTSSTTYATEFDLRGLLRMDTSARYLAKSEAIKAGWMAPNEARIDENLPPVEGGDTPYLQQQNFGLAALAKRDKLPNPFVIDRPTPNPDPSINGPATTADPSAQPKPAGPPVPPPPPPKKHLEEARELADALIAKFTRHGDA